MPSYSNTAILSALAAAASVSAHGFVESINIGGTSYAGYNGFSAPSQANPPTVVGWANTATDSGFVSPDKYNTPDIICHLDATNAKGHARVAAGDSVWLQWNTWPESHKGPVLDYLAACGADGCENVDKTDLKFFKIDEAGLLDGSAAPGHYAADELLENGVGWLVQIPESIKPGFYVLRHEIIALHSSQDQNGAQNYPQCINLEITGSGTEEPEGTPGMELYKPDDAGIFLNIYQSLNSYKIPGPAVFDGAKTVDQVKPEVTATGTATTGTELAAAPTNAPTSTSAASAPDVTSAAPEGEESGSATGVLPTAPTGPAQTVEITPGQPQPTSVEEPQAPQPTTCVKKAKSGKKGKRSLKNKKAKKARRGAVPRL